ncbi:MAG: lysozyme [Chloroflexi bacterium]|nr:lysozyme [Chloroflexota bacterium]
MNKILNAESARRLIAGVLACVIVLSVFLGSSIQVATAQTCSSYYKVQSGDTLSGIADKYGLTVQALATANNLKEPYQILVGQELCIPPGGSTQPTAAATSSTAQATTGVTVTQSGLYLVTVKATKLSAKTPYYVRLYHGNKIPRGQSIRLGMMKTDKAGNATKSYGIPASFYDKKETLTGKYATICLKNPWNDATHCRVTYMYP